MQAPNIAVEPAAVEPSIKEDAETSEPPSDA